MDIQDNGKNIHKGISRIDSKTTKGWLVRGYKNGIRYSKLFSDRKLGGESVSLGKAIVCRNELAARLCAIPSKPRSQKIVSHDKRNQTGVLGVSRLSKNGKGDKKLGFYSVTWRPAKGKQKCTSFSIAKYGETLAFKKAVSLRYERLCTAYGEEIATRIVGKKNVEEYVLKGQKESDAVGVKPGYEVDEAYALQSPKVADAVDIRSGDTIRLR
ncbi:MAG: hypothetical protein LBI61_00895 [Puniceicoccales bacterium]|jgi:hypothetical protein|nr:hypothetical protein [Puniceicoccales bacterium]